MSIQEIRDRLEAIAGYSRQNTPGMGTWQIRDDPYHYDAVMGRIWSVIFSDHGSFDEEEEKANAEFIAHCPQDVEWLLNEVQRLQFELQRTNSLAESIKAYKEVGESFASVLVIDQTKEIERLREKPKMAYVLFDEDSTTILGVYSTPDNAQEAREAREKELNTPTKYSGTLYIAWVPVDISPDRTCDQG